jgi:transcriptional regulator with GAF, ATPase, and Fis domain
MVVALRARIAELRTIFEISQEISAGVEFDETLQYILAAIHNVIPYDLAELSFYDEANRQMVVRATANYLQSDGEDAIAYYEPEIARTYPVDEGTLARLFSQGSALLVPDMKSDDDLDAGTLEKWDAPSPPRSYLGVVLRSKNKVFGALELVSTQPDKFTEDNSRLLTSIATQAAIEVQTVQEIQAREQRLAQQIQRMDIVIDKSKTTQQVEHIVTSDFFQEIQEKAKGIRAKQSSPEDAAQE